MCKFGCYGNSHCSLKLFVNIFAFADPKRPYYTCKHCLYIVYRTENCAILVYFWPIFGCRGNYIGLLESMFKIAVPENPTRHAKIVTISCTHMKLRLLECLTYLYHCGYRLFTALHGMQTRSSDGNYVCPSVCPSVCLSVKRVDCDKTEESCI